MALLITGFKGDKSMNQLFLEKALERAQAGIFQIPLYSIDENGNCTCQKGENCSSAGKHPKIPWKKNASNNPEQIEEWLKLGKTNLGILTGKINNIQVIDVDPKNGGDESLEKLWKEVGPIPSNNVVLTGSGGLHFYLKYTAENLGNKSIAQGIDIRTDGGYIVAPLSRHKSGKPYLELSEFDLNKYLSGEYSNELFK